MLQILWRSCRSSAVPVCIRLGKYVFSNPFNPLKSNVKVKKKDTQKQNWRSWWTSFHPEVFETIVCVLSMLGLQRTFWGGSKFATVVFPGGVIRWLFDLQPNWVHFLFVHQTNVSNPHTPSFSSIQFSIQFILDSAFPNEIVSRCVAEAETQSLNPPGQHSGKGKKNSLLIGGNLE